MTTSAETTGANGAIWAAIMASGVGSFALGLVVILSELGLPLAPSLYPPAGGVSGRTTIAALVWIISWVVLHRRWRHQHVEGGRVTAIAVLLILLGLLGVFPPTWGLL
jgi:hypothetical protein